MTYAGNRQSLADVEEKYHSRYVFVKGDVSDLSTVEQVLRTHNIDTIVHLAAESHVDRSIAKPDQFVQTNIVGTFVLLRAAHVFWGSRRDVRFHHVSTDEVYGSLGETGVFSETSAYDPRSPYSASKAASDHLVRAWGHTYGLPITLSNCSNNYGPFQFPEKLIPLVLCNLLSGKTLPVYGDGKNQRDWLYVEDHASALWSIITRGTIGETYNVGGDNQWANIKLIEYLCKRLAGMQGKNPEENLRLISHIEDRPGHDYRYAIDCQKIKTELGWRQSVTFEQGLEVTIQWYLDNQKLMNQRKSGDVGNNLPAYHTVH